MIEIGCLKKLLGPALIGCGWGIGVDGRRFSVRLSVTCLTLSRERKEDENWQKGSSWYGWPWSHLEIERPLNACDRKTSIFSEREGLRTSNLVWGWSTMTRMSDMRGDHQSQSSGWLFKSALAGGWGMWWPRYRPHSLLKSRMVRHICISLICRYIRNDNGPKYRSFQNSKIGRFRTVASPGACHSSSRSPQCRV